MLKTKKTFNLEPDILNMVKAMVGTVAPTQDGVVTRAVLALARQYRDREHTKLWTQSLGDPEFKAEAMELEREFGIDDLAAWEKST